VDYVDFADEVVAAYARIEDGTNTLVGVREIARELGIAEDGGVYHVADDLRALGIFEFSDYEWIKPTTNTDKIKHAGRTLADIWPTIFGLYLTPDQAAFVEKLVDLSHRSTELTADVEMIHVNDVYAALGWSQAEKDVYGLTDALERLGMVEAWKATGGDIQMRPRYGAVVRATRHATTVWQERLRMLLAEGETTTVDFKRELRLAAVRDKGEFVRDVLGLATTKASGTERFLLVGFDDETGEFVRNVDASITRDRLEQIINAYTDPKPLVDWRTVPWEGGTAGLVVVTREAAKIPYRVAKAIWKLSAGNVYVRHGTQTEAPTPAELTSLESEGDRARAENLA
jgi:Schlafen, AlbA_2